MKVISFIITASNKEKAKNEIDKLDCSNAKYLITLKDAKTHRSILQNNLSHIWYAKIAKELPEDSELGWKSYCKLNYGVPILRAEDEDFRIFYDNSIKNVFTYEQKLSAMKYIPVTSMMSTKQLSAYLDAVKEAFFCKVDLKYPLDFFYD